MAQRKLNQKGFGAVEGLLILVVVLLVGFIGYYVYNTSSKSSDTYNKATEVSNNAVVGKKASTAATKVPTDDATKLATGHVSVNVPSTWKIATGGYFNTTNGHCGQSIDSDAQCLDILTFVPSDESFTNPDQFNMTVSVFKRTDSGDAKNWFKAIGVGDDTDAVATNLTIGGRSAEKVMVQYTRSGDNVEYVYYGIVSQNYGVLVEANAFKGDYYSYKNTANTDYRTYLPQIDSIVKTIKINE